MSEFKYCSACGQQNNLSAQFCQKCGARYSEEQKPQSAPESRRQSLLNRPAFLIPLAALLLLIYSVLTRDKSPQPVATETPVQTLTLTPAVSAERMVLDDAYVTAYVECTHQEWKKYKIHFIIKKPGSPLLAPILRQAGNPRAYSVVVNGVDTGDDFAFSPNIAAFDKNGEAIDATFVSRPLNGNEALGFAYHDLIVKYESR